MLPINELSDFKPKTGVLLINVGTPEKPETNSIRKFLREFLSDPRVMDMPFYIRWAILNLFILPFRPKRIKTKYQRIWTADGSPLMVHSKHLVEKLTECLGSEYIITFAMRYGDPSIQQKIDFLYSKHIERLIVLPLMPQYASATSGTIIEQVLKVIQKRSFIPEISIKGAFHNNPLYIQAIIKSSHPYLDKASSHVLFSFHGLPKHQLTIAELTSTVCFKNESCCENIDQNNHSCYRSQCFSTARQIAYKLNLKSDQYSISFQSRLGKTEWIKPYTTETIIQLAKQGVKHLTVFCPSFVADCIETTDEIGYEAKEIFLNNGGERLTLIPSLNDHDDWIKALVSIIEA